jgi:hypothetical protein
VICKLSFWFLYTIISINLATSVIQTYHHWFLHVTIVIIPPLPEGAGGYTVLPLSVCPSFQDIFCRIFLSNCWWQKSDIWSQALYRYTILWVAFLDPSDSYFLFADFVDFYTHSTHMHIFLSNYWWQKSDIWSQASYRYPISWEAFLDPSDSYFLFADCWFLYTLNIYALFSWHFSQPLLMAEIWYLVTSFI